MIALPRGLLSYNEEFNIYTTGKCLLQTKNFVEKGFRIKWLLWRFGRGGGVEGRLVGRKVHGGGIHFRKIWVET
jgi:hypothetical protein